MTSEEGSVARECPVSARPDCRATTNKDKLTPSDKVDTSWQTYVAVIDIFPAHVLIVGRRRTQMVPAALIAACASPAPLAAAARPTRPSSGQFNQVVRSEQCSGADRYRPIDQASRASGARASNHVDRNHNEGSREWRNTSTAGGATSAIPSIDLVSGGDVATAMNEWRRNATCYLS